MTHARIADVVHIHAGQKDNRPGVILRVFEEDGEMWAFVPWGTGTPEREPKHVVVRLKSPEAFVLKLQKPTYFYVKNFRRMPIKDLPPSNAKATPRLLVQLQEMYGL